MVSAAIYKRPNVGEKRKQQNCGDNKHKHSVVVVEDGYIDGYLPLQISWLTAFNTLACEQNKKFIWAMAFI